MQTANVALWRVGSTPWHSPAPRASRPHLERLAIGVGAVSLGHGLESDEVVRHKYWGTAAVLRERCGVANEIDMVAANEHLQQRTAKPGDLQLVWQTLRQG